MARAWHLMSRPQGLPTDENFALKDVDLPEVADGLVRVRNRWLPPRRLEQFHLALRTAASHISA